MQRCFVLMRSARRFFTLQAKNLVCVYTGTAFRIPSSRPRNATLQASLAAGVRGWGNNKIDDTLPGWHIDGLGGRIFELHIALFKEQTPLTQPPGPILAFGNRLLHS